MNDKTNKNLQKNILFTFVVNLCGEVIINVILSKPAQCEKVSNEFYLYPPSLICALIK